MRTIWKFELEPSDRQTVDMPKGAKILSVQNQRERVCIWALVDDQVVEKEKREFIIRGTGHPVNFGDFELKAFLGTVQLEGGLYAFHVFELI